MQTKLLKATLGLVFSISAVGLASGAHASETASVRMTVRNDIAWVEADTTGPVSGLKIQIMAPGRGTHRSLWQTCRFAGSAAGTYRCGIDVSEGSRALHREGPWAARVFSGGELIARTTFTL